MGVHLEILLDAIHDCGEHDRTSAYVFIELDGGLGMPNKTNQTYWSVRRVVWPQDHLHVREGCAKGEAKA